MDERSQFIDISHFTIVEKIGNGGFSVVFKVKNKEDNKIYAAKMALQELTNGTCEDIIYLKREVNIMASLNHPCVLKFIGYSPTNFYQEPRPVIVTEYMENKTLFHILDLERRSRAPDGWDLTKKIECIYGIASAMSYLHENNIIHRDLKPQNILMDDALKPHIGDFGLSKKFHQNQESITTQSEAGLKGTCKYIAPEILSGNIYSPASDVYAFGIIVYEIMELKIPFEHENPYQIIQKVINNQRPEIEHGEYQSYIELIKQCWSQDPSDRPSFAQIVKEMETNPDFLQDADKDEFDECVDFIHEYKTTYDPKKQIILCNNYNKSCKDRIRMKTQKKSDNIFTEDLIIKPNDNSWQNMEIKAQNDPNMQLVVGICLIERKNNFPNDITLGIQYLEKSIQHNCIEAVIYLCDLLITGKIIPQDLKKAKKHLSKYLNYNDSQIQYLYGMAIKKEKKFKEAKYYFMKSAQKGNYNSMYEYGLMLFFGEGGKCDIGNAIEYFQNSLENKKSQKFLEIYNELNNIEFINLPIETQQFIMSKTINSGIHSHLLINFKQVQMLYNNKSIFSIHFIHILKKFNEVAIELEYPNKIFDEIYNSYKAIESFQIGLHIILLEKVFLPIKGIKDNLFEGCILLEKITIPSSVDKIGKYAFSGCSSLSQIIIPDESVKLIDEYAFNGCKSITQITIPSSVTKIGDYCFQSCISLKQIKLPFSISKIEMHTFWNCSSLTQVIASTSVIERIFDYGNHLFYHQEIQNNFLESCRLFLIAANNGYAVAMIKFACMVEGGNLVPANIKEACRYYKMAADKGLKEGIENYISMIEKGIEGSIDDEEACHYYKMAADIDYPIGMVNYGIMLENGRGVPINLKEACRYYKMAHDRGNIDATYHYGRMLENGIGIKKNIEEAIRYYKIASGKCHHKANEAYMRLTQ